MSITPMKMLRLVVASVSQLIADDGPTLAGHMSFTALLALFPFLIFLVALAGFLGDAQSAGTLVRETFDFLPEDVAGTLEPVVNEILSTRRGGILTFSILGTLWVASGGVEALRAGLNRAYGAQESRPLWLRRLQSVVIVVISALTLLLLSFAIILGPIIWSLLSDLIDLPPRLRVLWDGARYLLSAALLVSVLTALHRWLPNVELRWPMVLPGAIVTTILWLACASLFSLYLAVAANYNATYGSLGGVIVTLVFFYLSALIFMFGAEINAELIRRRDEAGRLRGGLGDNR